MLRGFATATATCMTIMLFMVPLQVFWRWVGLIPEYWQLGITGSLFVLFMITAQRESAREAQEKALARLRGNPTRQHDRVREHHDSDTER